jgi:hypothetical protein
MDLKVGAHAIMATTVQYLAFHFASPCQNSASLPLLDLLEEPDDHARLSVVDIVGTICPGTIVSEVPLASSIFFNFEVSITTDLQARKALLS